MSTLAFDPDNGGAIGRALRWAFGRSWRTTVLGLLSLTSTLVTAGATMTDAPGPLVKWAPLVGQAITSIAIMLTKDAKVSGENRPTLDPSTQESPK